MQIVAFELFGGESQDLENPNFGVCTLSESMATIRNLKIKTSTCKRIEKELHSYEKEVEREAAKTAAMKDKGADPYDLKQQVQISQMIFFICNLSVFEDDKICLCLCCVLRLHLGSCRQPFVSCKAKLVTGFQIPIQTWFFLIVYVVMQENVLGESRMMIPDCHKRLEAALAELKSTLVITFSIVIDC